MKRYSTIMSVLLTLALPVAATCAETPKDPEQKPAAAMGAKPADAKPADAKPADGVDAVADTMKSSKHSKMMGALATQTTGKADLNPSGKVMEAKDGGGYTYARLEKDGKETWVAYTSVPTQVGDMVSFTGCMEMRNFPSKALNRTFDSILFCGEPQVASAKPKKSPGSTGAAAVSKDKVKVEKATGANAYTVSEVFAKRKSLNGKQVVVRGQVVKTASGIMNKNWIHLQDGTGSAKDSTNDLVVTSNELPADGSVVTISGTVASDKDFGSGYKYKVIMEKGSIKK